MASDEESLAKSKYGIEPKDRPIDDYIKHGMVIVDKPRGPTSHQVSAWVKQIFNLQKAGHSGTLDPNVSGVLPIVFEDGTRALDVLHEGTKEYVGILRLHSDVQKTKIKGIFEEFTGELYQTPPVSLAGLRKNGRRRRHYSAGATTPPPYRERSGGVVPPPALPPLPELCRGVLAGFGGVSGVSGVSRLNPTRPHAHKLSVWRLRQVRSMVAEKYGVIGKI